MSENAMTNIDKTADNNQEKELLKILPPQLLKQTFLCLLFLFYMAMVVP
ncbi:hypothetical protein [Prevotella sp. HCN-7019]